MSCGDCREFLLEAEPGEIARALGGASEDRSSEAVEAGPMAALREHLQACPDCAGAAKRILEAGRELASGLESLTPLRPLSEAVSEASQQARSRRGLVLRTAGWGAAAAAASILIVWSLDFSGGLVTGPGGAVSRSRAGADLAPGGHEVEAMLDESVMILETDNEDVVVFWFYQGRGE
jgi:predicted anti-sigma-YlaC factor YlaD